MPLQWNTSRATKQKDTESHRITESQNVRGWKGPLWVVQLNPLAQARSSTAGCTGPRPSTSSVSPEKENPQPMLQFVPVAPCPATEHHTTFVSGIFWTMNHGRWDEYFREESLPACPDFIFFLRHILLAITKNRMLGKTDVWAAPALPFLCSPYLRPCISHLGAVFQWQHWCQLPWPRSHWKSVKGLRISFKLLKWNFHNWTVHLLIHGCYS